MNLGEQINRVLRENGLSDQPGTYDSSIHSWRCEHPDMYGPCDCLQELEDDLLNAVREWLASGPVHLATSSAILGRTAPAAATEALNALINRTKSES